MRLNGHILEVSLHAVAEPVILIPVTPSGLPLSRSMALRTATNKQLKVQPYPALGVLIRCLAIGIRVSREF